MRCHFSLPSAATLQIEKSIKIASCILAADIRWEDELANRFPAATTVPLPMRVCVHTGAYSLTRTQTDKHTNSRRWSRKLIKNSIGASVLGLSKNGAHFLAEDVMNA